MQALKPKSLYEACELARVYERRNVNLRQYAKQPQSSFGRISRSQPSYSSSSFLRPSQSNTAGTNNATTINHSRALLAAPHKDVRIKLTDAEFESKRAKKQCYFCDASYVLGHNCRRKGQLMSIEIVPGDMELINAIAEQQDEDSREVPPITDMDEPLIRLQAMGDENSNCQTM